MSRAIPEWVARHDDQAIPRKVGLRVLEANDRKCWICGNEIAPGAGTDIHHKTPLADGGRHAESNLAPVHRKCHRLTAREAQERAESRATIASHYGLKKPKMQGRGFRKAPPQLTASRPITRTTEGHRNDDQ
jgi:5-methylcytosine-specific restriction protein A